MLVLREPPMIAAPLLLFLGMVIILAAAIGWLTGWDMGPDENPAAGRNRYDPARIQKGILEDQTLSDRERQWMQEVAALELPRRHLVC